MSSSVWFPSTYFITFLGLILSGATGVWLSLAAAICCHFIPRAEMRWVIHSWSDVISFGICSALTAAARNTNSTDDAAPLQAQQCNNRLSGVASSTNIGFFSTHRTHTRTHTHTTTATAAAAAAFASSMCYFANCNPGQDNKMASRHFVNISVLAQSAPGRLLTDRCVDWIPFYFFFHRSSALLRQTAREQGEASTQGG